jgi:hypothetical protein
MICIDTRHRDTTCRHYTQRIKAAFPEETTKALHSPIAPVPTKQHDAHSSVGGQLIILTHKWAGALITHFTDKSKLGLVSGLYLTTGLGQLLVIGTYLPIIPSLHYADKSLKPTRVGGLWERAESYLQKTKSPLTPHDYIHAIINGKSERHLTRSPHNRTILCGDFNIPWDRLSEWAVNNNWASPSIQHSNTTNRPIHTYYSSFQPTSHIDHILISPAYAAPAVLTTTTSEGPFWELHTDHRPLWIHLSVPGERGTAGITKHKPPTKPPPTQRTEIEHTNPNIVKQYQEELDSHIHLFDPPTSIELANNQLLQVCSMSVATTKRLHPKRPIKEPRSSYKNGWSPTFITIKLQRIALLNILGHTLGLKGRKKWQTKREQDIGIAGIITNLETTALKLHSKQPEIAHALLNDTPYPLSYWRTLTGNVDTALCIRLLKLLRDKIHGEMRQAERIKINDNIRHRENMIALGKHSRYFKLILGEHTPFHTLDSLDTPTGIITDPKNIHETLTSHMSNHHSTPLRHQNGIHQTNWNWQTGGTKQEFLNSISHHNIPPPH